MFPEPSRIVAAEDWTSVRLPPSTDLVVALWPVLLFDILVSDVSGRRLNIAQDAVLDMIRLGLREPKEIGRLLHLDPDLVEIVIGELTDENYLDERRLPTDLGETDAEVRSGLEWSLRTAFQDPFTGRLWPRIVEQVFRVPLEWRGDAQVIAFSRSRERFEYVEFDESRNRPAPPSPRDVVEAMKDAALASTEDQESEAETGLQVETISDDGRLAWAPAVLFLPPSPDDIDGVSALGIDGRRGRLLLDALVKAAARDKTAESIRLRLDRRAREAKLGPYREYVDRIRSDAEDEVERLLGNGWRAEVQVWSVAVDLRARVLEIDQDPTRARAILAAALMDAGRLLEHVGRLMALSSPFPPAVAEQLERNGQQMKKTGMPETAVIAPAVKAARRTWAEGSLPSALPGKNHNGESAEPTGAYWHWARAVAAAHHDEQHALRRLLREHPDWLLRMGPINNQRNNAAHASRRDLDLEQGGACCKEALELAAHALRCIDLKGGQPNGGEQS